MLDSYTGSEELFLSMGKAYIIAAGMHFFGMETIDSEPTLHPFPEDFQRLRTEKKSNTWTKWWMNFVVLTFYKGICGICVY